MRNAAAFIRDLCAALDAQTLEHDDFEVLLVDDGSVDGTTALVASWIAAAPSRRRLVQGLGRGPAHARNLGVRQARGVWVAFTDADAIPDPDWLATAVAILERTGADALEGAVDPGCDAEPVPQSHYVDNRTGGRYLTANMVYRRELLQRVGGFDERFATPFLEDSDLAFRVLDLGVELSFAPEVRVRHPVRALSPREALRSPARLRWLPLLAAKHPERYRTQFRPLVRPLSGVDADVLLALAAVAAVPRTTGLGRVVLVGVSAKGLRTGLRAGRVLSGPTEEVWIRAVLALALPPARAWWWLAGCARHRRVVW
jgi:glycosyltransferase involved in cell wall biosynthesis